MTDELGSDVGPPLLTVSWAEGVELASAPADGERAPPRMIIASNATATAPKSTTTATPRLALLMAAILQAATCGGTAVVPIGAIWAI
jgi:hypothetical protein